MSPRSPNRYDRMLERIFSRTYVAGAHEVSFTREALRQAAVALNTDLPKNLGDVLYSSRVHSNLPEAIRATAPQGKEWVVVLEGRGRYRFVLLDEGLVNLAPRAGLAETRIPDSTPGVISRYAQGDEQALLAKLRYNRLIDIFTSVTCYSLQSHLRTTVEGIGQVETDEVYVGIDRRGAHYVFRVEAKGGQERVIAQVIQNFALCDEKFSSLICRAIAAQFKREQSRRHRRRQREETEHVTTPATDLIVLFEFEKNAEGIALVNERHYRLVPPEQLTAEDLQAYRARPD